MHQTEGVRCAPERARQGQIKEVSAKLALDVHKGLKWKYIKGGKSRRLRQEHMVYGGGRKREASDEF